MAKELTIQLTRVLDDYSAEVREATNKALNVVAKETVKKLKNESPRRTGDYAKGWGMTKSRGVNGVDEITVRNKDKPQLTHLLEESHIIRNGKGEYGRSKPIKHIEPVEEWANEELPKKIEEELSQ